MKLTSNKNTAIIAFGSIDIIVMALVVTMFVTKRINESTFFTAMIITCLATVPIIFLITRTITDRIKTPRELAAESREIDLSEIELPKDNVSRAFEASSVLLIIGSWIVLLATHRLLETDGSIFYSTISALIFITFLIGSLVMSGFSTINMPLIGKMTNVNQVILAQRMYSIIGFILALGIFLKTFPALSNNAALEILVLVCIIFAFVSFRILINKAK